MNHKNFFSAIALLFIGFGANFAQTAKPADKAADDAVKRAVLEAKNKESEEKNKEIEKENAAMNTAFAAGNDAIRAKKYDEAIAKFADAVNAYPNHPGVPTLLQNMSISYFDRGAASYASALKATDIKLKEAGLFSALSDFLKSEETAAGAAAVLREQVKVSEYKTDAVRSLPAALRMRATALRAAVKLDLTRKESAIKAFNEYIALETTSADRIKARLALAQMCFDTGDPEQSGIEAVKVLTIEKDAANVDALFLVGVSYAAGDAPTTRQLGANHLKRFLDLAPANDRRIGDGKAFIDYLKSTFGIVPK